MQEVGDLAEDCDEKEEDNLDKREQP